MHDKFAYFFKSFSHNSRNKILRLLAENQEMTVDALGKEMQINPSTISRHLNTLKMQGVVQMRVDAPSHYYSINETTIINNFKEFMEFLNFEEVENEIKE
ncbi:winged helix-turn-helix transcriptional regulator [Halanaerobiaceae bacterium Z-7014]|uniref:Winged helix-turn-helix transcriptional regulator n=1 Tax=Halonatronomonas betaini TaxID=2778430 RepID=A0A931F8S4_9FIRM|nr:metalloregulator ArsR/SmtB family transcription factor [Halonatronomonas betaini]MBF8436828.1 winged helix-turn-helix transcriptional regulator [Halonatronomonas betaini]